MMAFLREWSAVEASEDHLEPELPELEKGLHKQRQKDVQVQGDITCHGYIGFTALGTNFSKRMHASFVLVFGTQNSRADAWQGILSSTDM
ncbi:hypothetical protein EZI45_22900 [Delftia tsuruhatensis]|nr:hypothetical protein [Delftia tsuruhatensis]TDF24059.1 hypothetical protein EZI45_22900 [Delftia tsuruhatensis]